MSRAESTGGSSWGDDAEARFALGEWLRGDGTDPEIAICTRIRFARNIQGFHFPTQMSEEDAEELLEYLQARLGEVESPKLYFQELTHADELDRRLLMERHLVSRELAGGSRPRAVAIDADESVSIMLNEEDHLRTQVFASGNAVAEAYVRAEAIDEELMQHVPFAFSEEFGFLTSCPTNTGTGLRVSVMLHLPGLVWANMIDTTTNGMQKINMAVRGLFGEGSRATGDFYQVSNQITLGRREEQIIQDVGAAVDRLVETENEVRTALLEGDKRNQTEDKVFRALGTLREARILTSEEALTHLSAVRFGANQGLLPDVDVRHLNAALLHSQPAHLQKLAGTPLTPAERDARRAGLVRELVTG